MKRLQRPRDLKDEHGHEQKSAADRELLLARGLRRLQIGLLLRHQGVTPLATAPDDVVVVASVDVGGMPVGVVAGL